MAISLCDPVRSCRNLCGVSVLLSSPVGEPNFSVADTRGVSTLEKTRWFVPSWGVSVVSTIEQHSDTHCNLVFENSALITAMHGCLEKLRGSFTRASVLLQVTVPVVGGHAGVTILPLLSQVRAPTATYAAFETC